MNLLKVITAAILLASFAVGGTTTTKTKKLPKYLTMDEFTITSIDKESIHLLSTKKGFTFDNGKGKVTLLVVWSNKCTICPKWIKDINELYAKYSDKLNIVALEIGNMPLDKLDDFTMKNHITFPMFSADNNKNFAAQTLHKFQFFTKYRAGLPLTITFGYKGQTNGIMRGTANKKEYETYIKKTIEYNEKHK